jgi:CIC family chloride channel protein
MQLARRKELITHHKDKAVLSLMKVDKMLETNFAKVQPHYTLGHLVEVVAASERNIFPVTDDENNFLGIVVLNDIRNIMFKPEMYDDTFVRDLMFIPKEYVDLDDSMEEVASKIQSSGLFNIVVLHNGKYLGFVSRANVFSTYRRILKYFSED